ncbi:MAG: large-conductance mechanosensitive channel protein MscL [Caldilineaceae bacterium]|nr:large-conductance mechanosensitive channel protein MscL [Caldilineaceae bacterium]
MWKEFRAFISRGNVMELAVAVVIGAAFGTIVNSLVNDMIMPLVGIIIGGIDFTGLKVQVGRAELLYGNFIQAVVNFLVIAASLFLIIRGVNAMQRKPEKADAAPPKASNEEKLLGEIRDLLKKQTR